ncbi:GNAT family N-acetyltransferase [Microvirga sp. GCM10011540]|uniref:GNAT family N-acetyltransferase n=1 Tax=Microvirga sp. GCM10011540 TaxID=3317338 RepID=UPI003606B544
MDEVFLAGLMCRGLEPEQISEMTTIKAESLALVPLRRSHASQLYTILSDPRLYDFIPDRPPETIEELEQRYSLLEKGTSPDGRELWLNWAVFTTADWRPVGIMQATVRRGIDADIAYIISRDVWGVGYGRTATRAMIDHIFTTYDLQAVRALVDTRNYRSIGMIETLGLKPVRFIRNADHFKGEASDEYEFVLSYNDWRMGRNFD